LRSRELNPQAGGATGLGSYRPALEAAYNLALLLRLPPMVMSTAQRQQHHQQMASQVAATARRNFHWAALLSLVRSATELG